MRPDNTLNHIQLMSVEAVTARKPERFEPKLARLALTLDVDVRRLIAIEAREEEPIRSWDSPDPWHSGGVSFSESSSRKEYYALIAPAEESGTD
jgi:hypothetical protein